MRLLVVENDDDFRKRWVDLLREFGNEVIVLPGLSGQRPQDLHKNGFDLALVDRRCQEDSDQDDTTGQEFAVELCRLGTPTVLVTAFLPKDIALFDLLRTGDLAGIADKSFDMGEVAMCVDEFSRSRRFPNCVAKFHWKDRTTEHFGKRDWQDISDRTTRVKADPYDVAVLFRSLIPPCARRVEVETITPGHGGAALLRARVWSGDGPVSEDVAIKYGERTNIGSEAMRYDRHVGPLPDGVAAHLRWRKETSKLGALAYSWVGNSVEDGVPFGPVGSSDANLSWSRRRSALSTLFYISLDPWYTVYRGDVASVKPGMKLLEYYQGRDGFLKEIPFHEGVLPTELPAQIKSQDELWDFGAFGRLTNPVIWLKTANADSLIHRFCPCHGDLHVKNIFVLPDDSPRLIDFGDTALGHVFRDFAALEASILLTCANTDDISELRTATDCTASTKGLGDYIDYRKVPHKCADLREVLKTIMQIRRAALDAVANHSSESSFKEYLFALVLRLLRYAQGIADEVSSKQTAQQKAMMTWHALYASASAAQQAFTFSGTKNNAPGRVVKLAAANQK